MTSSKHGQRQKQDKFHVWDHPTNGSGTPMINHTEPGLLHRLDAWASGSGPLYQRLASAVLPPIARGDLSVGGCRRPFTGAPAGGQSQHRGGRLRVVADEQLLERRQAAARACAPRRPAAAAACP